MKTVIVSGSMRKNGACENIAEKLAKISGGGVVFSLANNNVEMCRGDLSCCIDEDTYCYINDDLKHFYKQLEECDHFILVSPIYEGFLSGAAKNFLNRINKYSSHYKLEGKLMSVVLVGVWPEKGKGSFEGKESFVQMAEYAAKNDTQEFSNEPVLPIIKAWLDYYMGIIHVNKGSVNFFQMKDYSGYTPVLGCEIEERLKNIVCPQSAENTKNVSK